MNSIESHTENSGDKNAAGPTGAALRAARPRVAVDYALVPDARADAAAHGERQEAAPARKTTRAQPAEVAAAPGVLSGRGLIDAIDAELIELIGRRIAVSAEIQSARMSDGGRRLDLRRENEVIGRYTRAHGRPGTAVALALLELGRGRV